MTTVRPHFAQRGTVRAICLLLAGMMLLAVPAAAQGTWMDKVDASVLKSAGLGQTDFIVYMRDTADLHPARALRTKAQKGAFVYEALTSMARTSQAPLVAQLQLLGVEHRSFWISNAVLVRGDAVVLEAVATRSDVEAVFAAGVGRLDPPVDVPGGTQAVEATTAVGPSIDHVRANEAWELGYRGQGAVVAGADTGVRWTHNALRRQYRGWDAVAGTADHDYNWHDAIKNPNAQCPAAPPTGSSPEPCDDDQFFGGGHGTHTIGTIVGDDGGSNQIGVAPDAQWIACRNMNNGLGAVPTYMDCMQWFIAPTDLAGSNPDPTRAPDVVNNSWGCVEACAPPLLKDMIDASRAAGIFYVVSAGNDGMNNAAGCNTVAFPLAVYESSFTVGATNATNDNMASFSSRGPVLTNPSEGIAYRKPDIVAPGVGIRSALRANDNAYGSLSGTSMSGPHVAGLVALIISANPALRGDVDTIEDIIRQTAVPLQTNQGCGGDSSSQVPNNTSGWGRIDALAAVQLAVMTDPSPAPHVHDGELLDPAHNAPIPCELVHTLGSLPRSAKNIAHVANVCGIVGTDVEFQSRADANGEVHDYVFVGTMGAGTRIYDVTDPRLPRHVGGYVDPGWQNDVQVFGDTLILAFDPVGVAVHASDCLRTKDAANGQTRGGVDFVHLTFDPFLATLKAPLTFKTERKGCYLTEQGGGAHTITIHHSGEWLALNTSSSGIEVVDLRNDAFTFVRKIPSAIAASAHDVFFSEDGDTMYVAGVGSTRIVDVRDIFNRPPQLIANVPNNPSAAQGADGHVVAISHQSDTTADGRLMIVTDEKGGGLNQTACNTSAGGAIGGAHFWALEELPDVAKSGGATVASPRKIGTWIYPNPLLAVDALDDVLAGMGRTERACTIHVYRAGGNGGQSPAAVGAGKDGFDGVSRLPVNEIVSAHYGAGVWHVDVMAAPGPLDDSRTTWARTLGWNVMPGADTWSAKEYKGYIYAGDMARGFDIYSFRSCDGIDCVDLLPSDEPTPTPTPTLTPTPTPTPTPTATPTDPGGCAPDHVYFLGIVYDAELREDFRADVRNFEHFLATLRESYCIPESQSTILAMEDGYTDPILGKTYADGSEANLKAELRRMGADASRHDDSLFFFFLSSHGNVWSNALPGSVCPIERVVGSFAALGGGGGEDGFLDDCELGFELNQNFSPQTRMFVAVDCSFCGGFSDSLTAASGTIPDNSLPDSSGVPGPNRIVITGCAITTECFGSAPASNGGVTYHHMRRVLQGEVSCDGWTAPGFPGLQGFDVPVNGEPFKALDGRCTASEWFFGAVWSAYSSGDVIGIQQQFRIKYGMGSLDNDILIVDRDDPDPTPTPTPTPQADLVVSAMTATSQKPKEGEPVVISATISNTGAADAPASQTEFRLDDGTLLGVVDTPAIAAGAADTVEVGWDTRGVKGEHVIDATADVGDAVDEADEDNNVGRLSVTIRGNKVQNASFEQPNSDGDGPDEWEGNSTAAGRTGWSEGGSDGDRAVTIGGTGRSVALHGAPSWTSAPISVSAGELLTLTADVHAVGLSSAPTVGLALLGPAGELLSTVSALTAPLSSGGFVSLEKAITVPDGVTSLRIVLYGFAPTDLATAGTVTFDNIGLYGE